MPPAATTTPELDDCHELGETGLVTSEAGGREAKELQRGAGCLIETDGTELYELAIKSSPISVKSS
jgi:hypothetical protein